MKTLELHTILSGIAIILLFLAGLFYLAYLLVELQRKRNKQEDEFEITYTWLSGLIETKQVNSDNYDYLLNELKKLGQLPHKNKEKTVILTTNFFMKFKDEAKKRI
jgi:hypothetical protein